MSGVSLEYAYAGIAGVFGSTVSRGVTLGNNPGIDTATAPQDVWAGAVLGTLNSIDHRFIPRPPNVAANMELVSSSANDTLAGTGARSVTIVYLDASYVQKIVTLSMNGTTPVALPEPVMRVNSMVVATVGTFGGTNLGNLSIRAAGGLGATFLYTTIGTGLSRSSLMTVPAGMTLDILSLILSINRSATANASFSLCIQNQVGRFIKGIELSASNADPYRHEADGAPVTIITEKSDVWWRCESVSVNNTNVTAGIYGVLRPAGIPFAGPFGLSAHD